MDFGEPKDSVRRLLTRDTAKFQTGGPFLSQVSETDFWGLLAAIHRIPLIEGKDGNTRDISFRDINTQVTTELTL